MSVSNHICGEICEKVKLFIKQKTSLSVIIRGHFFIESVKWRALRALRVLRAFNVGVPSCPRAHVPKFSACPRALHVGVPSCPRAKNFGVPSCHRCRRALVPACPTSWRTLVPSMSACPRARVPKFSVCPRAFDVDVQGTLEECDP